MADHCLNLLKSMQVAKRVQVVQGSLCTSSWVPLWKQKERVVIFYQSSEATLYSTYPSHKYHPYPHSAVTMQYIASVDLTYHWSQPGACSHPLPLYLLSPVRFAPLLCAPWSANHKLYHMLQLGLGSSPQPCVNRQSDLREPPMVILRMSSCSQLASCTPHHYPPSLGTSATSQLSCDLTFHLCHCTCTCPHWCSPLLSLITVPPSCTLQFEFPHFAYLHPHMAVSIFFPLGFNALAQPS